MAGVPFWGNNDAGSSCAEGPTFMSNPWDTFWVNDLQVPGKCSIRGNPGGFEIEKYKGHNQTGASIKMFGYLPGEFDLVVEITTSDQWDEFQELEDAFWPGPQKNPILLGLAIHVRHPELQRLKVNKAVLFDLPLSEPSQIEGGRNFIWKFYQSSLPKATKTLVATGALPPEDAREPASNGVPSLPSTNPANMTLDGPPLTTQGGAQ